MRRFPRMLMALTIGALGTTAPALGQQAARPAPTASPSPSPARAPAPRPTAAPATAGAPARTDAAASPDLDPKRMEQILEQWATRTQDTHTLYARFTRDDWADDWQTKTRFQGTAFVKRPNLAYLNFEKTPDDGGKPLPSERIVCTGPEIYQFLTDTKQVHVYPLPPDEQQRSIEEGPLPFLFNMDAAKVRARYQIRLVNENAELYLIGIKPLIEVDRDAFSQAYIWLDRVKLQPTKIQLHDPANFKNTKTYNFTDLRVNVDVKDTYFDAKAQWQGVRAAGWDLVMHGPDGQPVQPDTTSSTAGRSTTTPRPTQTAQPVQQPGTSPPR